MKKRRRQRRRYNGCGDKVRYASAEEATAENPGQWKYECVMCGCWHLTSQRIA